MIALAMLAIAAAFMLFARASGVRGPRPAAGARRLLRGTAWVLLILSGGPSILAEGWVFGPILWMGLVMAGAGAVFLGVNLVPAPDRR